MRPLRVIFHRLPERLGRLPEGDSYLWLHGASVGEVQLALRLAGPLRDRIARPVLVTSMTPEGLRVAQGKADLVLPFPIPLGPFVRRYLDRLRPRAILVAETELWPALLGEARRRGIPVVLFNGRISQRSFGAFRTLKGIYRRALEAFSLILVRSEEDRRRFLEIGAPEDRVRVTGDLKLLRPFEPDPQRAQALREELCLGKGVMVAGSIHPGEDDVVLWAFSKLRQGHPDLRLILVPRHVERAGQMLGKARALGFKATLRTRGEEDWDCLVVDTVGELRDLYGLADVALVGGSLREGIGGHNCLEPLVWGVPTLYGPHGDNFSEITRRLLDRDALYLVRDEREVLEACEAVLGDPQGARQRAQRAQDLFAEGERALEQTVQSILEVLGG